MIIFKVFKASRLCTAMSVAVFVMMLGVWGVRFALTQRVMEEEAVPVMAAAVIEEEPSLTAGSVTPSINNLFYLPDPQPTPKTVETELEDVPDQSGNIRFEILTPSASEIQRARETRRILIYHTHTWEAYEPTPEDTYVPTERWRTKDENYNIVRVGAELAQCLETLGFEVVHERGIFEPPVLSTAYTRSLEMLEEYTNSGEIFDYYIDLHRDAYSEGVYKTNTVTGKNGEELARLMMLIGKGTGETGGAGFDIKPDWEKNKVLADELTLRLNAMSEGLCGNVKLKTGRFNQHVSTRAILIEVGNNMNTLTQALNSMPYLAQAIKEADEALSGL